jgi:hypothetical protein
MTLKQSPFHEIHRTLVKYNNPIALAYDMNPEKTDLERVVNQELEKGGWITVESVEQVQIDRNKGYCNFVYLEVCFLKTD